MADTTPTTETPGRYRPCGACTRCTNDPNADADCWTAWLEASIAHLAATCQQHGTIGGAR